MNGKIFYPLALLSVLLIGLVSAAPSISISLNQTEGIQTTYLGDGTNAKYMINLTVTDTSPSLDYCNITIGSTLTSNVAGTVLNGTFNTMSNQTKWNFTARVDELEDANNYIITATCNTTNDVISSVSTTLSSITIDNGVPTAPTTQTPADATVDQDGNVIFSATVVDADTTSCTVQFSSGSKTHASISMAHSGTTCTTGSIGLPAAKGEPYLWFVRASDETNVTDSASVNNLKVETQGNAGARAFVLSQQIDESKKGGLKTIHVILIGAGIFLYLKRKK